MRTAVLALTAAVLLAQPAKVEGTWDGRATSAAAEPLRVSLVFSNDGATLVGHILWGDAGKPAPLQDLVLENNAVSFWMMAEGAEFSFEGVASDREIRLKAIMEGVGITYDVVLTRKTLTA
jgi:hypothetical protein